MPYPYELILPSQSWGSSILYKGELDTRKLNDLLKITYLRKWKSQDLNLEYQAQKSMLMGLTLWSTG